VYDLSAITPVEHVGNIWLKREDLFNFQGFSGAKVRATISLFEKARALNYPGVACYASRGSPQLALVSAVAKSFGMESHGFCANAVTPTDPLRIAKSHGMVLHEIYPGYPSVVKYRASAFADKLGFSLLPFGLCSEEAFGLAEAQALAFLSSGVGCKRLVTVAGSGTNLVGVLRAMVSKGCSLPVLAVLVGHDCRKTVAAHVSPKGLNVQFVFSPLKYHQVSNYTGVNGVALDLRYDAKAVPYLQPGDLLWVIGRFFTSIVPYFRNV